MTKVQELSVARRGAMGDAPGLISALTIWTPIIPGHLEELEAVLEGFPNYDGSPAARIETTHLFRWLLVPQLVHQGPPMKPDGLRSQYLVFTAAFDGSQDDYLEAMRTRLADECDAVWSHCVGYPGTGDRAAFARYMLYNKLPSSLFLSTYPDASVAEIRAGLELKKKLIAFAVSAQGMEAEELHRTFCETFA